jgi:hypothetical protein
MFRRSHSSGLSFGACWNTKILAMRILTEIDLNLTDLDRDTLIKLV